MDSFPFDTRIIDFIKFFFYLVERTVGLVVMISASQADDAGSIPARCIKVN